MYRLLLVDLCRTVSQRFITTTPSRISPIGDKPIQLYSLATPNGQKIGIALEEFGLEYDAHLIDISQDIQYEDWFKKLNPNSKIPILVDRQPIGNHKQPITIFESGAILIYLADKTGKFLASTGTHQRYETIQWLMWQMSGVGPMFGQANHFHRAAKEDIVYAKNRYLNEAKRLLKVLDTQLAKTNAFVSGSDYTIADIATFPWVRFFIKVYKDKLDENAYSNIEKWLTLIEGRPQVQKGLKVCSKNA
ncbi:unnamed protein product [Rotaria sp. Silwood1]|nr:unnamed protein product [Rotaria sp. Silwood1]CAF3397995.1 unnamed protein product [Rotaria sp. Silwood1]CAF4908284.1 unnamed protein product [Rotaria sp. Silwood1]